MNREDYIKLRDESANKVQRSHYKDMPWPPENDFKVGADFAFDLMQKEVEAGLKSMASQLGHREQEVEQQAAIIERLEAELDKVLVQRQDDSWEVLCRGIELALADIKKLRDGE